MQKVFYLQKQLSKKIVRIVKLIRIITILFYQKKQQYILILNLKYIMMMYNVHMAQQLDKLMMK